MGRSPTATTSGAPHARHIIAYELAVQPTRHAPRVGRIATNNSRSSEVLPAPTGRPRPLDLSKQGASFVPTAPFSKVSAGLPASSLGLLILQNRPPDLPPATRASCRPVPS